MNQLEQFYRGRRVFVTGYSGFKGSWLSAWLVQLGAEVAGYALAPPTAPNHIDLLRERLGITTYDGDVRDPEALAAAIAAHQPSVVFHLAAQPLVLRSIVVPQETFAVNVMGSVNTLEAIRHTPSVEAAVIITSDKCYLNVEQQSSYREVDRLGGTDPYGASKAAAEIAVATYQAAELRSALDPPMVAEIATARAGNVIGGGDWAAGRLVPDLMRWLDAGTTIRLRRPKATRPWQHVLEPLSGYLVLGSRLGSDDGADFRSSWNFGPAETDHLTVEAVTRTVVDEWGAGPDLVVVDDSSTESRPEATLLHLDSGKAHAELGWRTVWSVEESLRNATRWYRTYYRDPSADMAEVTIAQIAAYTSCAAARALPWASAATVTQPEAPAPAPA